MDSEITHDFSFVFTTARLYPIKESLTEGMRLMALFEYRTDHERAVRALEMFLVPMGYVLPPRPFNSEGSFPWAFPFDCSLKIHKSKTPSTHPHVLWLMHKNWDERQIRLFRKMIRTLGPYYRFKVITETGRRGKFTHSAG